LFVYSPNACPWVLNCSLFFYKTSTAGFVDHGENAHMPRGTNAFGFNTAISAIENDDAFNAMFYRGSMSSFEQPHAATDVNNVKKWKF